MVALAVIAIILAALTLDAVFVWLVPRHPSTRAQDGLPRSLPDWLSTPVPAGLSLTAKHVWIRRERDNLTRVGGDGFATALLGRPEKVKILARPGRVTRGQALASLLRQGKALVLPAPVNGTLVDTNESLDPKDVVADPFGRGWLVTLRPDHEDDRHIADLDNLREGTSAMEWLRSEWERARQIVMASPNASSVVGAAMADGGPLQPGFLVHVSEDCRQTVERTFFGTEPKEPAQAPTSSKEAC